MNENEFNSFEQQEKAQTTSGLATAGMILGIIGVATSFIPIVNNISFVLGILALIFGLVGLFKKSFGKAIPALILGVLSIAITLAMQAAFVKAVDDTMDEINSSFEDLNQDIDYASGNKTQDILNDYLDVTIGTFTVTEDEYWDSTELTVQIRNKGTEKKSFTIKIEAIDANGNRLNTDSIYANDLSAGQAQQFKIFTYVSSDQIATLKTATFRVLEVSMY